MLTNTRHHALNELGSWFLCVYFYLWLVSTARNTRVHMRLLLASHFSSPQKNRLTIIRETCRRSRAAEQMRMKGIIEQFEKRRGRSNSSDISRLHQT